MIDKLGRAGLAGVALLVVGIVLVAWRAPIVAAGIALSFAGLGLVAKGLVSNVLRSFGFA